MKRWLYISHRWIGIVLSILFVIWFTSGVVMLYVSFPSFRDTERLQRAEAIAWDHVMIGPDQALSKLDLDTFPDHMRLAMLGHDPVYHMTRAGKRYAVSAQTGEIMAAVDQTRAKEIAKSYSGTDILDIEPLARDQWTTTKAYARISPFWRVRLDDNERTDLYIRQATGEIVQNTTAQERFWNWLGAVPHWLYFEVIRVYQEPWRQTVLWASGIGIIGAIAGLWIGLLRIRLSGKRYANGAASPYGGWMKWHHITGLIGGIFVITWTFSGWLSMSPFGGLQDQETSAIADRYRGPTQALFAATDLKTAVDAHDAKIREVHFWYLSGRAVMTAFFAPNHSVLLDVDSGQSITLSEMDITTIAKAAVPHASLIDQRLLTDYDTYWYTTNDPRKDARPLPVWRLKFDNSDKTWLHINPQTGELLNQLGSSRRGYRWLFSALHSFDLPILLKYNLAREIVVWIFSFFGLALSFTGIVIGWRRLRKRKLTLSRTT